MKVILFTLQDASRSLKPHSCSFRAVARQSPRKVGSHLKSSAFMLIQTLPQHSSFTETCCDYISTFSEACSSHHWGTASLHLQPKSPQSHKGVKPTSSTSCTMHTWKSLSVSQKGSSSLKYANKIFLLHLSSRKEVASVFSVSLRGSPSCFGKDLIDCCIILAPSSHFLMFDFCLCKGRKGQDKTDIKHFPGDLGEKA